MWRSQEANLAMPGKRKYSASSMRPVDINADCIRDSLFFVSLSEG
jgi:hypothetical protein